MSVSTFASGNPSPSALSAIEQRCHEYMQLNAVKSALFLAEKLVAWSNGANAAHVFLFAQCLMSAQQTNRSGDNALAFRRTTVVLSLEFSMASY